MPTETKTTSKRHLLLTGAGFTKNFGGFLADEMWTHIFNNPLIQQNENIRKKLIETAYSSGHFNYELAYHQVIQSTMSKEEKERFKRALLEAYGQLERSLGIPNMNPVHFRMFLEKFRGTDAEKSFFFTTNQDRFIVL